MIKKTYKLYIGGKFPRTESGRVTQVRDSSDQLIANLSQASRKDFREAVVAARKAAPGWSKASAYLKGQILYRIAEMLDGRRAQFVDELTTLGVAEAADEVQAAIDLLVHYPGWSDKFQALASSVNPVASSHFNFSVPEPSGVVAIRAPEGLLGLVSAIAPVIVGGNTCVVLSGLSAISFAEVLATSDVPAGVVNILTGDREELVPEFAKHMDVNSVALFSDDAQERKGVDLEAAENLKRVHILAFQEIKTTWHPIGV